MLRKKGKQGGEKRNNLGRLPNFVGRSPQQRERNAVCAAVGIQKMPPKRGHVIMISLERRRSSSAYRELELRISQTRYSEFSNKMFGVHKQDVRSSQTGCSEFEHNAQGMQEQKGSDIEHKDTQTLRIVRVALAMKGEIICGA